EVYGYTIQLPSSIPQFSFVAQFNPGTGVLTINGDPEGFVDDAIVLKKGPGNNVNVNVMGADLLFPAAPITAVTVQTGVVFRSEVYGYTIQLPSSIPQFSFVAQFNPGTGVLTINGDPEGFVDDAIVLKKGPGNNVNVNVMGADLLFPAAPITAVTVQTGVVL